MKINRIVFVGRTGTLRAPMAVGIMKKMMPGVECAAKGLVVLFPEPMNQKVEAVLASHDITLDGFMSSPLTEDDFLPGTLVVAMGNEDYQKIIGQFESSDEKSVILLSEYVEEELEVIDPYGQSIQVYGLCYETLSNSLAKLKIKIQEEYHE